MWKNFWVSTRTNNIDEISCPLIFRISKMFIHLFIPNKISITLDKVYVSSLYILFASYEKKGNLLNGERNKN